MNLVKKNNSLLSAFSRLCAEPVGHWPFSRYTQKKAVHKQNQSCCCLC